jgi:hypothetical protein
MAILIPINAWADKTDEIVNNGKSRIKAGASSQKRIDDIAEKTDKIISQYHQQRKIVEGLKTYNDRLRRTIAAQKEAVGKLERSIEEASLIERQIVPLMIRMIEGLDKFIAADLPFKLDRRQARVERIRGYLTNANVSAAERFRQVLEAYSTENDYGKSISVYTDVIDDGGNNISVNILQVGRAGLYYQTLDGQQSGYWDKASASWVQLDSSHDEGITTAIRITQGKESRDLMTLPLIAPEAL